VVESAKSIVLKFLLIFIILDGGFTGNDNLSLNVREGLGDNSDGYRLLVFIYDSHKRFILLVYASIEAIGLSQIFSQVSPDV
jgi:hypothetical protein